MVVLLALLVSTASAQDGDPIRLEAQVNEFPWVSTVLLDYGNINPDPAGTGWLDGPVFSVFDMADSATGSDASCTNSPCAEISLANGRTLGRETWTDGPASVFYVLDNAAMAYFDGFNSLAGDIADIVPDQEELVVVLQASGGTNDPDWPCNNGTRSTSCMRPGDEVQANPSKYDIIQHSLPDGFVPAAPYEDRPMIFLRDTHQDEVRVPVHEFGHYYNRVVLDAAGEGGGFPFDGSAGAYQVRALDEALGYWYVSDYSGQLLLGRSGSTPQTSEFDVYSDWPDQDGQSQDEHWIADVLTSALWHIQGIGGCDANDVTRSVFRLVDHNPPSVFVGADPYEEGSALRGFAAMFLDELELSGTCSGAGLRDATKEMVDRELLPPMIDQGVLGSSPDAYDRFGEVLLVADLDGDTFDDLIVGVPQEDDEGEVDNGLVQVIWGGVDGIQGANHGKSNLDQDMGPLSNDEDGDRFGAALAVGDFDGDTHLDLAVGSPDEDYNSIDAAGLVQVWYGDGTRSFGGGGTVGFWHSTVGETREAGDRFGAALVAADFTGDGIDDLAIGVPGQDVNNMASSGMVTLVPGSGSGLVASNAVSLDQGDLGGAIEAGDQLGSSLAAGRFSSSSIAQLVVGSPLENWSSNQDSGVFYVVTLPFAGWLRSSDVYNQASFGRSIVSDEHLGWSFGVGDLSGDGLDDLVVGSPLADANGTDSGRVDVLYGSSSGLVYGHALEDGEAYSQFGFAVACGDVTGFVAQELVVSAPYGYGNSYQGGWLASYDSEAPGGFSRWDADSLGSIDQTYGHMGWSLVLGNFDASGRSEAAFGAPGLHVDGAADAGVVCVRD